MMKPLAALVALAWSADAFALPSDWPCWRGPNGDNVSHERDWSPEPLPEPLWRADVGMGYSSPAIADGRLVIAGYFPNEATPREGIDRVSCLDFETGAELWRHEYPAHAYDNEHAGGTLSTATIAAGVVYLPTRDGTVRALDLATGEPIWTVDLVERHGVEPGRYGFASSPFLLGKAIVLNAQRTVMLERRTGATVWISDDYDANYSTVAPIRIGDRHCLATFGGKGLALLDDATGAHVATYEFRKSPRNVEGSTPIVIGESVFVSTAYEQGAALVDFSGGEPVETWRTRAMRNKMAGCTLFEGHFYGFDESMLKCIGGEGNERWRKRGLGQGALTIAGGRLLTTTSKGELLVAEASPDEFRELARVPVVDHGVFWTAPVLVDGRVVYRGSLGDLVCLDHRGTAARPVAAADAPASNERPTPAELAGRHRTATGVGPDLVGTTMSGRLHINALGIADSAATWSSAPDGRLYTRFDLPPGIGGQIARVFDGERAWETNPYRGDKWLEEAELDELRRTNGHTVLFDPIPDGCAAETVGLETLRGVRCQRVDVEIEPGRVRSLFFDAESGRLAAHEGEAESTVLFDDWREVGDVELPFARTMFHPDTGQEMRWRFEQAEIGALEAGLFEVPESLSGE